MQPWYGWRPRRFRHGMNLLGVAILVAVAFAAGSVIGALGEPSAMTYYGCIQRASPQQSRLGPVSSLLGRDGTIYGVNSNAPAQCERGDAAISWNQVGPAGEMGATGATGPIGVTGVTGPSGPTGAQGPGRISWSGAVNPDGTTQFAPNVTVTHDTQGVYVLTFASGSFVPGTIPVPMFTVADSTITGFLSSSAAYDGSATVELQMADDTFFNYTVTGLP